MAERIGTTQQTIARWETGKAEPTLAALRDLAVILWTSIDHLLGRKAALAPQSTNPFAWISGDKSGYWGNIGLRLPQSKFSTWYPITTSTMEDIFRELQEVGPDTWISFQTLNNKMVLCRPAKIQAFTFLDEAEDQVDGDWEVGPDEVEGWPQEVYECLEYLMWEDMGVPDAEREFSDKLITGTRDLIEKHELDEKKLMEMCIKTRVAFTDGTVRLMHASSERLANAMFDFDLGIECSHSKMLHLNDEGGDHSVFLSLDLISRLELPLLLLKKGMEDQLEDYAEEGADSEVVDFDATKSQSSKKSKKREL